MEETQKKWKRLCRILFRRSGEAEEVLQHGQAWHREWGWIEEEGEGRTWPLAALGGACKCSEIIQYSVVSLVSKRKRKEERGVLNKSYPTLFHYALLHLSKIISDFISLCITSFVLIWFKYTACVIKKSSASITYSLFSLHYVSWFLIYRVILRFICACNYVSLMISSYHQRSGE
jgi:hypothetical protein